MRAGLDAVVPPWLQPGDRVVVVAPSSCLPRARFLAGLAWLRGRYRVEIERTVFARKGYLAGDDSSRLASLASAMCDPGVRAIVAGRGGYGATRIVSQLPWAEWARRPSWLVGFSDITALHIEAQNRGIASLHAPNVTGLADGRPVDRLRLMRALEGGDLPAWPSLVPLRQGAAVGRLVGGNLSLVMTQAASGILTNCNGAIVVLEDVTEKPYQLDRMLNALVRRGLFQDAAGIVFGEFAQCPAGRDGVTVIDVLEEFTDQVTCPVYWGAPFGHGAHNEAMVLGLRARIIANALHFGH
jgi:muramoyltetrapeptide carboxypeptidase